MSITRFYITDIILDETTITIATVFLPDYLISRRLFLHLQFRVALSAIKLQLFNTHEFSCCSRKIADQSTDERQIRFVSELELFLSCKQFSCRTIKSCIIIFPKNTCYFARVER